MKYELQEMCNDCPWRPDSVPGKLDVCPEEVVHRVMSELPVPCVVAEDQYCVGACVGAILNEKYLQTPGMVSMQENMGLTAMEEGMTTEQFVRHHEAAEWKDWEHAPQEPQVMVMGAAVMRNDGSRGE